MSREGVHGGRRCPYCGKYGYRTRKEAKVWAKRIEAGGGLAAYPCKHAPEGVVPDWHLGHLPREVVRGVAERADVTQQPRLAGRRGKPERRT